MALSFGSTAAAPASGFNFSGGAPSSAPPPPAFGSGFANTTASTAPSSAFSFAAAPAPSFGAAPAPLSGGSFNLSSFASAPPPSSAFSFSNTAAPPSNAPPNNLFVSQQQQQQQQQIVQPTSIHGGMLYKDLTPQMKQSFDVIHEAIMRHKRSMLNLQSMAPQLLLKDDGSGAFPSSTEHKPSTTPLIMDKLRRLHRQLDNLTGEVEILQTKAHKQIEINEKAILQCIMFAKWPVEAMSHRKGIRLCAVNSLSLHEEKKDETTPSTEIQARVRESLDRAMSEVDRIEKMPSPFLWQVVHDMESRLHDLAAQSIAIQNQCEETMQMDRDMKLQQDPHSRVAEIVESQHEALWLLSARLEQLRGQVELVRFRYNQFERGENVITKAAHEEIARQRRLDEQVQLNYMLAPPAGSNPAPVSNVPGQAPGTSTALGTAPAPSFSFSASTPAPAPPTSFSFAGSTPATTAPASTSAFSFTGASPAPPSTGFSFASNTGLPAAAAGPTPLPAFGQPAPAPTTAFGTGATSAPPAAFSFNAPTTAAAVAPSISVPSTKKKASSSTSRNSRLRR